MGNEWPGEIMDITKADGSWSKKISRAGVVAEINQMTCNAGPLNLGPGRKANRSTRAMQWSRRPAGQRQEPAVRSLRSEVIRRVSQAERVRESEIMT